MSSLFLAFKLAFKNLYHNLTRTGLSLLGIVIGVLAIVLVMSLGAGVKKYVVDLVKSFGDDIIEIEVKTPKTSKTSAQNAQGFVGGGQITTLKLEDAEEIAKLPNVRAWYAGQISQNIVRYKDKNKQVIVIGFTPGILDSDEQMEVEYGRFYTDEDEDGFRQVAVLGSGIKEKFFGEDPAVGKSVKIQGQRYKVIGVLKDRGVGGFFDFDNTMYVPMKTLQKKIMGVDHIISAVFRLHDVEKMEDTRLKAELLLRDRHGTKDLFDDDFSVNSITEIMDILDQVFFVINALLLAVTSISLIVGGVGIMNVMYVAVTERTFEIGLRKAVGAKKGDILSQFLIEAIILTIIGGLIGVLTGVLLNYLANYLFEYLGYSVQFATTLPSILLGVSFSAGVGLVFGFYPARKASLLTPVEAMRK